MPSERKVISSLLLLAGAVLIAVLIFAHIFTAKAALVASTLGIVSILLGVYFLDSNDSRDVTLHKSWLAYVPLLIGLTVIQFDAQISPIVSAIGFAIALTMLFAISATTRISRPYVLLLSVFLFVTIGFSVFNYYALDIGKDSFGYLSVAAEILRTGRYSLFQPTQDQYYWPFPIMAIASSVLASVSGLNLLVAEFIFPGGLILLQPLLVFLLSRRFFADERAAALSAFLVTITSALSLPTGSPLAESTALSLLMLFLLLRTRERGAGVQIAGYVIFAFLVALHGAVGLLCILLMLYLKARPTVARTEGIVPLTAIFTGYLLVTSLIDLMFFKIQNDIALLFFIRVASREVFPTGSSGLIFVWWGLPVALGLTALILQRRQQVEVWAFAGLGVLGLSFVANVVAPSLVIDRYTGLMGWLILSISGGRTMRLLTRTSRQLAALMPVVFVIALSAVVYPPVSPQYGLGVPVDLPTTQADRLALDWIGSHALPGIVGDGVSISYLDLVQYQLGVYSIDHRPGEVTNMSRLIEFPPDPSQQIFLRWADAGLTGSQCSKLVPLVLSAHGQQTINIVYNNGCAILEAAP